MIFSCSVGTIPSPTVIGSCVKFFTVPEAGKDNLHIRTGLPAGEPDRIPCHIGNLHRCPHLQDKYFSPCPIAPAWRINWAASGIVIKNRVTSEMGDRYGSSCSDLMSNMGITDPRGSYRLPNRAAHETGATCPERRLGAVPSPVCLLSHDVRRTDGLVCQKRARTALFHACEAASMTAPPGCRLMLFELHRLPGFFPSMDTACLCAATLEKPHGDEYFSKTDAMSLSSWIRPRYSPGIDRE